MPKKESCGALNDRDAHLLAVGKYVVAASATLENLPGAVDSINGDDLQ